MANVAVSALFFKWSPTFEPWLGLSFSTICVFFLFFPPGIRAMRYFDTVNAFSLNVVVTPCEVLYSANKVSEESCMCHSYYWWKLCCQRPPWYAVQITHFSINVVLQTMSGEDLCCCWVLELNIRTSKTSNLNQAHLPAPSTQVPRFLLDLVCHKSTEPDSHLAVYKFKPPPYPGFLLTTLIHTCPRHMQRPREAYTPQAASSSFPVPISPPGRCLPIWKAQRRRYLRPCLQWCIWSAWVDSRLSLGFWASRIDLWPLNDSQGEQDSARRLRANGHACCGMRSRCMRYRSRDAPAPSHRREEPHRETDRRSDSARFQSGSTCQSNSGTGDQWQWRLWWSRGGHVSIPCCVRCYQRGFGLQRIFEQYGCWVLLFSGEVLWFRKPESRRLLLPGASRAWSST